MPLTNQYLRYSPSGSFNIIASPGCNGVWTQLRGQEGRFVAAAACENIIVWDLQLGEKAAVLHGEKTEVCALEASPIRKYLAAGYRDGCVKTFDVESGDSLAVFSGHKSSITCLGYDEHGHRLASGSKDTHIVVWDVVSESGVCRLSAHTGPITQVSFIAGQNTLISSSEDTSIKFWDLDTSHCFKTLLGHRTEVWGMALMRGGEFLVTGSGDSELRVWRLSQRDVKQKQDDVMIDDENDDDALSSVASVKMGAVLRSGTGRVVGMTQCQGTLLAVHAASDTLEIFHFLSHLEALRRLRKRRKRERKKAGETDGDGVIDDEEIPLLSIVRRLPSVKSRGKIKSASLVLGKGTHLRVLLTLNNNTLEIFGMNLDATCVPELIKRIAQHGHHSEVRALAFSSDSLAVASGAADTIKLWNRASLSCLRTVSTGYVLSLVFVPGDRHVLAGLKDGSILVCDVSVGHIVEQIPAHTTEVWSLCLLPNQRGCVSGAGDCTVKMWDFELVEREQEEGRGSGGGKVLSLLHKKTLTLEEPVLCVRITPNSKLIAVALLDMTIKVFFLDTLKFFISLYGHKLPVTTMDISHDSALLVSGSADRNVKLWGLDFGDCHKSIFAHDAAISAVQFVPDTHYFFSCGKDGAVKQWDADNYQKIISLKGHFGEAWTLAVSPNGEHVVTSGSDRVVRMISKTDEPLVLEDEAEEERAREDEDQLLTGPQTTVRGQGDLQLPSRKTVGSERGAEQLLECLEICRDYEAALAEFEAGGKKGQAPPIPHMMQAYQCDNSNDYLVDTIRRIRSGDLEEALVMLPFSAACELLKNFPELFRKDKEVELLSRTLAFLLKVHHGPIVGSKELLPVLNSVQQIANQRVSSLRNMIGCNFYGMQFLQRDVEERQGVQLFRDATLARKESAKKKKRKEKAMQRAVLAV